MGTFAHIARAGIATRGFVYLLIGVLAYLFAFGSDDHASGNIGTLATLALHPLGRVLVALIALGLACHTVWRIGQSIADTDHEGRKPLGLFLRFASGVLAVVYAGLTYTAVQITIMDRSSVHDNQGEQAIAALLLAMRFGQGLLALVGVGFCVAGIVNLVDVYRAGFKNYLQLEHVHPARRMVVLVLGRLGAFTHAVLCFFVASFFFVAVRDDRAREAQGLAGVIAFIAHQHFGTWLLASFASGLVTYGSFELFQARYRRVV